MSNRARGSSQCPHHKDNEVVFVCEDCEGKLICKKCVSTIHKRHALEDISDFIPQLKVTLQDFVNKTEKAHIPELREGLKSLDCEVSENQKHYKNIISKIQKQNECLKQELDKITDKWIKLCREIENQNNDIILNHKENLQSKIEELDARIQEVKDTLQAGTNIQVYDTAKEIPNDSSIPSLPSLQYTDLTSPAIVKDELEKLMGQLSTPNSDTAIQTNSFIVPGQQNLNIRCKDSQKQDTSCSNEKVKSTPCEAGKIDNPSKTSPKGKVETFKLFNEIEALNYFNILKGTSDNHVWVHARGSELHLLNDTGKTQRTIKLGDGIKDFCASPSTGDIWFCSRDDNRVRKVTVDNKSRVMFSTENKPASICISADGNVLVGMIGQIVKYSQRGQILCKSGTEVKWLIKKGPVVRYPYRISTCTVTSNIAVSDWDIKECGGDSNRHISILSEDLQLLYRYYGRDTEPFYPWDVCYGDTGDIYIADFYNGSILQISGRGEFIQTVYTDSNKPAMYVCVQSNGDIWAVFRGMSAIILQKQ